MKPVWHRFSTNSRWSCTGAALALAVAAIAFPVFRCSRVLAAQEKGVTPSASGDQATSLKDQTDLAVTVYNSNIALVRDVRNLSLPSGLFRLKLMDIAATVNPTTVH